MRARTAILAALALSVLGCASDPTSVSEDRSLARATIREYIPVQLGDYGVASGINDAGQIVGWTGGGAALWDKGVLKGLGNWGNEYSVATTPTAINNRGQVVGYSYEDYGEGEIWEAFLWDKGKLTGLGFDVPSDINERGQIVGYDPIGYQGFLWEKGVRTELDFGAHAINNAGQIIGGTGQGHAVIWDKGRIVDLGLRRALDINDRGQVVGSTSVEGPGGFHAFLWEKGVVTDLGTLGGEWSIACAINNAGQIVGYSATSEQYVIHAFLWEKGVMADLGTLNGRYAEALGINQKGDIVGSSGPYEGVPGGLPVLWTRRAKVE